jgi:uncharacterized protein
MPNHEEETPMISSLSSVITPNASLLLRKLCKHWSHKFDVRFNETNGEVDFSPTQRVSFLAHNEMLSVHIAAEEERTTVEKLEEIIADHLKRFAFKEELTFSWQRDELPNIQWSAAA